ncbi:MAG TPA: flagellar hook capping FlgD N-terminal domain-containing protein [Verrucomicrobiae bacterium]|nr:flagellar hook capping FlgD N-terminal domain-containing protein [Verrucomicrobiae bacterium]
MTDAISSSSAAAGTTTAGTSSSSGTAAASDNTTVTKNMFLQLLVAQIKNQDPLNPTDSVQFLTQLAQFQQLEQSMNMGEDLSAARSDLDQLVQATTQANTTQTN